MRGADVQIEPRAPTGHFTLYYILILCPPPPPGGVRKNLQVTTEGEYVIYIDGLPFKATQNTLGELNVGEALDAIPVNIDPSPPTRWGRGYKGPRRESFPLLPDEYALDADETPLDQITVKTLTACFTALLPTKLQTPSMPRRLGKEATYNP
eukprot:scaffold6618_cov139-Isochrysis_galbana.AAC.8